MEKNEFQKLWKTFEIIAIGCVLFGILLVLYLVRALLTPFIIAFVITFFLSPIVDYMEGEGINRTFAVILLIILTLIFLFILWKLTWPTIQTEISSFQKNAPFYISKIQDSLNRAIDLLEKNMGFIPKGTLEKALQQKINSLTSGTGDVSSLIKIIKELVTTLIVIPFVTFFLVKDGRKIKKMLIAYVPNKYFETFLTLFYKIDQQISNYIRGQLIDSFIVGVIAIIGLYLFRVNYAFLIGVVLGMFNIIPYIGPSMGFVFGSLLILIDTGSTVNLIKFICIYVCIRVLDDIIISPLVLSRRVHVHTLMVIIVIMLGGFFHGILGMLLAVPLYCSIKVTFQILYRGFIEYGNW
ncbi:MAG: AI-2E family transporter [Thermodesulfobacteriota bacterium]|jgi:predicted PurR-regulated permease PerM